LNTSASPHGDNSSISLSAAYVPRLPVLRRPPGWSVLNESALRARAVLLFHACVPVPGQGDPPAPDGAPAECPTQPPASQAAALVDPALALSRRTVTSGPAGQGASRLGRWSTVTLIAPLGLLILGLALLSPWLIWAPLMGGLCVGILLIQTGLIGRWLSARRARVQHQDESPPADASADARDDDRSMGAPTTPVQPVRRIGRPGLRVVNDGWLLTAALVLVGVQAAILIATFQVRRPEAAPAAKAAPPGPGARTARDGPVRPEETESLSPPILSVRTAPDTDHSSLSGSATQTGNGR
jgi:hypothetical protein